MGRSIFQNGGMPAPAPVQPMSGAPVFNNPMQKMNFIMQAMTNPAQFVKNRFQDIPDEIMNNPNQIMQYLQQTRGINGQQMNQMQQNASIFANQMNLPWRK